MTTFALSDRVLTLDLGEVESREHLVRLLQERHAEQREALTHPAPAGVSLAVLASVIDARRAEIALVEEVLVGLGEPVVAVEIRAGT